MTASLTALVLWSLLFAGASTAHAERANPLIAGCRETTITRLRIGINGAAAISPVLAPEIRRVVDEVWNPYGVEMEWSASPISVAPRDADFVILVRLEPIASAAQTGLGAVIFGPTGPARTIQLSASTAIRWIRESRYPSFSDQQLLQIRNVARAVGALLGRAAAHELGHVLLSTKAHAKVGLMAPVYTVDQYSLESPRERLDAASERRLLAVLGEASPCRSAVIGPRASWSGQR